MAETLTPAEAAARVEPRDSIGVPLGTGQPGALFDALGERDDWEDLRVYGALLLVNPKVLQHPNVHYLSGFFGPIERALRDQGANISFAPADFRRFAPLLEEQCPAGDDDRSRASRMPTAGAASRCTPAPRSPSCAAPVRIPTDSASSRSRSASRPRSGCRPITSTPSTSTRSTCSSSRDKAPFALEDPPPTDADRAIAEHAAAFIPEGATLQTGIGSVPSTLVASSPRVTAATTGSTRRCSRPA